jgi:hypothetical protein
VLLEESVQVQQWLFSVTHRRKRTKPRMIGDAGVEDVLHTAWCGRVIPKACQPILPPLVAEARESREDSACAWMLTDTRLWCVHVYLQSSALAGIISQPIFNLCLHAWAPPAGCAGVTSHVVVLNL